VSEIEAPAGSFKLDLDTARLRKLKVDELSLDDAAPWAAAHFSHYDNAAGRALAPVKRSARPRRSGLDELRAPSEEIKRRHGRAQDGVAAKIGENAPRCCVRRCGAPDDQDAACQCFVFATPKRDVLIRSALETGPRCLPILVSGGVRYRRFARSPFNLAIRELDTVRLRSARGVGDNERASREGAFQILEG